MAKKKEKTEKKFVLANDEFQPLLRQIYLSNMENDGADNHLPINVDPDKIICLRLTKGGGKKYAYVRPISKEYTLLTEARYFMVFCNEQFDFVTPARQKYIVTHEYCHPWFDTEKQEYTINDHDVKDFSFLLKDHNWNTELVKDYKYEPPTLFGEVEKGEMAVKEGKNEKE
jgi:hypothetical protein